MTKPERGRVAVILDRDGTLNTEVEYLHRIEDLEWIPGAAEAIRRFNDAAILVIVATNQAGVARGFYTEDAVRHLHQQMDHQLEQSAGARVDAWYYCPHHADGRIDAYRMSCADRKPEVGLYTRAIAEWNIDPSRSFVVGDKNTDLVPGHRLGMTTVLVETGYGRRERASTRAHHVVADIGAAANVILQLCNTTP